MERVETKKRQLYQTTHLTERKVRDVLKYPFVSVIIASKRKTRELQRCLKSLEEQNYPSALVKIIIASVEPFDLKNEERVPVTNIVCGEVNQAKARNIAETFSKGEILAFCDDDCVLPPDWIKNGAKHFTDSKVAAVGGPTNPPLNNVPFRELISGLLMISFLGTGSHRKAYTAGSETRPRLCNPAEIVCANLFVDRVKFHEVGGFDGIVPQEEDRLNTKFVMNDYKLVYDPDCFNIHYQRPYGFGFIRNIFWLMAGQSSLTMDRFTTSSKWYLIPPLFVIGLTLSPFLLSLPFFKFIFILVAGIYVICVFAETWRLVSKLMLDNRKRSLTLVTLPFIFLIHHIVSGFGFLFGFLRQFLRKMKSKF
jgi:glycosyltransferase involved in cell wall biosynthesis